MEKPNVILIVIDALRARNLGCYGYDKPTTPVIDSIADKGALFEKCFSTVNATDASFTTILSGKFPATHGMVEQGVTSAKIYWEKLGNLVLLQSMLKENGYFTIGVDWMDRWLTAGFDHYSGPLGKKMRLLNLNVFLKIKSNKLASALIEFIKSKTRQGLFSSFYAPYDRAHAVTDHAIKTIPEDTKRNFFLFIHYWDTHIPYNPPSVHLKPFQKATYSPEVERTEEIWKYLSDLDWKDFLWRYARKMNSTSEIIARYDGSLHYVDSEIGRLMRHLEKKNLLKNTMIIITADHGESLTEHGIYFDHHGLYDELIHVPLIIFSPGKIPVKRVDTTIQHVDIFPTILELTGIDYRGSYDGESLTSLINSADETGGKPFVYVEEAKCQRKYAVRTEKFKYIFALSEQDATCSYCGKIHGGVEELYDLQKDPGEKRNIVAENPEIRTKLREMAVNFRAGLEAKRQKQRLGDQIQKLKSARKI